MNKLNIHIKSVVRDGIQQNYYRGDVDIIGSSGGVKSLTVINDNVKEYKYIIQVFIETCSERLYKDLLYTYKVYSDNEFLAFLSWFDCELGKITQSFYC